MFFFSPSNANLLYWLHLSCRHCLVWIVYIVYLKHKAGVIFFSVPIVTKSHEKNKSEGKNYEEMQIYKFYIICF